MNPTIGLKGIIICGYGTLLTSPSSPVVSGFRAKGAKLTIADEGMTEDYKGRQFPGRVKFMTEFTSKQFSLSDFNNLLTHLKAANKIVDVQAVTALPYTATTSATLPNEGIYNFAGAQGMGVEFEFIRNLKENTCKITTTASYSPADARNIIALAKVNTPATLLTGVAGEDITKYVPPAFDKVTLGEIVSPAVDYPLLAPKFEVYSLELKMKLRVDKNAMDVPFPIMIDHEIVIEVVDSSPDSLNSFLTGNNRRLGIDILNQTAWESYMFPANSLMYKTETEISDEKRLVKLTFKGASYLYDAVYSVGIPNGNQSLSLQ